MPSEHWRAGYDEWKTTEPDDPRDEDRLPYQRHSTTSKAAAKVAAAKKSSWLGKVKDILDHAGPDGLTDDEIQTRLGMNPSTQRPRRIELVDAGWAVDSKRTRKTRSGRAATVWVARHHVKRQTGFDW